MACKMCHGSDGEGDGKLGKAFRNKPPTDFTRLANPSPQKFFNIIKHGSPGTGMVSHKKTLKDREIWDLVRYIWDDFVNP